MSTTGAEPFISVIVPVFNNEGTVARAVRSVLEQSFTDFELVVVDDGSIDGTAGVLAGLDDGRIRLIHQKNSGASAARNAGIGIARGHLVTFLDADDVVDPGWLASLSAPFQDPSVGLACCGGMRHDGPYGTQSLRPSPGGELLLGYNVLFLAGSFMVRGDLLAEAGPYAGLSFGENYDLGYRIVRVANRRRLSAAAVDSALVTWYSNERRSADRDLGRLEAAEHTLDVFGNELSRAGRAGVHRIAAVNARRIGRPALSLRHAGTALVARPDRWANWRTFLGVVTPRALRRRESSRRR